MCPDQTVSIWYEERVFPFSFLFFLLPLLHSVSLSAAGRFLLRRYDANCLSSFSISFSLSLQMDRTLP
uniref:Uncharacterized protein n=1 Tax=Anopheles darlingi TaxID=43151 RepID=A0A2M4DRV2_ANODA